MHIYQALVVHIAFRRGVRRADLKGWSSMFCSKQSKLDIGVSIAVIIMRWQKNENLKSKYNGRFIKWAHNVKARCPACAICGTTKFLMAHHIIPKKYLFEGVEKGLFSREYADSLLYNPGNGVTLCVNCHKMAHEGLNIIKKWNVPDGGDRDE